PRMRQHTIGTGPTQTDVFQVDAAGRLIGETLRLPGITLPTGEVGDVGSYMQQGSNWSQYNIDTIGNITQRKTQNSTLIHTVDNLSRLTSIGNQQIIPDPTDNLPGAVLDTNHFTFDQFVGTLASETHGTSSWSFT